MGLFSKAEYKDVKLPYILEDFIDPQGDMEAGIISIEFLVEMYDVKKYLYGMYILKNKKLYEDGSFEKMLSDLKNNQNQKILVTLKIKNNKIKRFKINLEDMAKTLNNQNFLFLSEAGYGINEKSCKEKVKS